MRSLFFIFGFVAVATVSAFSPAIAQNSTNEFQLPPSASPSATPSAEGPTDDSGIVPVGPRTVETEAQSPPFKTSANTQQNGNSPAAQPVIQPEPQATQNRQSQSLPSRQSTTQRPIPATPSGPEVSAPAPAAPAPAAIPASDDINDGIEALAETPLPNPAQTTDIPTIETATQNDASALPNWSVWAIGGLLALFAGGAAFTVWQRRKKTDAIASLSPSAPTKGVSKNKQVTGSIAAGAGAGAGPNLVITLEIEQLCRSMMMMTLKCRITIANRNDKAVRDVTVCADLVSANRALPMDAQIACKTAFLAKAGHVERIAPHKTQSVPMTLTLPMQDLAAFKHGERPMFVPLVRARVDVEGQVPIFRTFVVGITADPSLTTSSKLHPVPLDGIPGSYSDVRARPLANPPPAAS